MNSLAEQPPSSWSAPIATPYRDPLRRRQPIGDLVEFLSELPIVSRRFRGEIEGVAPGGIDFYPVLIGRSEYFIMAVRVYSAALDEVSSEVLRTPTGRVRDVVKFFFQHTRLPSIFKLTLMGPLSWVLITDALLDRLVRRGLSGLGACREAWKWDPM